MHMGLLSTWMAVLASALFALAYLWKSRGYIGSTDAQRPASVCIEHLKPWKHRYRDVASHLKLELGALPKLLALHNIRLTA